MVTLTKKQLWKENDEWVVVGLKQNKSVEKGWVLVPDRSRRPPVDEPDRVDKILARYAERETHVRPSPLVRQYSKTKMLKRCPPASPQARRMQALGSQGAPQARSCYLRGRRRDQIGAESRRQVRSRSQRSDRSAPSLGHHVDVFPEAAVFLFFCFFGEAAREASPLTPRPPVSKTAGCTTACTWTTSPSPSRTSPTRRTSTGSRRRDEARRARIGRETEAKDPLLYYPRRRLAPRRE